MSRLGSRRGVVVAVIGVAVAGMVAVLVALIPSAGREWARRLRPDDARLLALGQKVYVAQCAACHGQRLEGEIIAVLSWIKSRWPPEIRQRLDRMDAQPQP